MKILFYVVRLGGNLYIQSEWYALYPITTGDVLSACFFRDITKAQKVARKNHGEVIPLVISDDEKIDITKEEKGKTLLGGFWIGFFLRVGIIRGEKNSYS